MERNKLKTFNHYFKRFITWSFCIAGAFYFSFTFVVMTTIPTMKSSDFGHASHISTVKMTEAIQMSLGIWQFMFWLPIIGGLAFTVIEAVIEAVIESLMSYSKRRHQLSNTAKNNVGEVTDD